MASSHIYRHLVVQNENFRFLLTYHDQQWQFYVASDIYWSTMAILCCNLQVFLAGIGDTFVTLKANAHEIIT